MSMKEFDIPLGLGMALAQNVKAMERFSSLSDAEKQKIVAQAHSVNSRNEMHMFVERLAGDSSGATM